MVVILAQFKVQQGKEAEADAALKEMAQGVESGEQGAQVYMFSRNPKEPSEITVFEVYADEEAFSAHGQTDHMTKLRSAFGTVFDPASVKVQRLERLAGFVR